MMSSMADDFNIDTFMSKSKITVPFRCEPFGKIGWSTADFETMGEARAWARANRSAEMPCWKRAECWGGAPLGT
jgi:hypothetical protein